MTGVAGGENRALAPPPPEGHAASKLRLSAASSYGLAWAVVRLGFVSGKTFSRHIYAQLWVA